ncbi:MAG TPA: F0F1 ATP synthase subunit A [Bacillota bacterium]
MTTTAFSLAAAAHGGGGDALFHIGPVPVTRAVTALWLVMALILLLGWLTVRRLEQVPNSRLQNVLELTMEALHAWFSRIMGPERAWRYLPVPATLFLVILIANYSGLIPVLPHLPWFVAPTSHWGVTIGLAVFVFLYVQYTALRETRGRYYKHLVEPLWLTPLMLPLGLIEELVRPFSLSLRLFANIFAGETALAVMISIVVALPFLLPLSVFVTVLELVAGFVQALIFTTLTAVYIGAASEHHH